MLSLELVLLILAVLFSFISVLLGISTHIFQIRTNIRESLEQLDDVVWPLSGGNKLKPILHDFRYLSRRRGVTVEFDYLHHTQQPAGVSDETANNIDTQLEIYNFDPEDVLSLDNVEDITLDSDHFRVDINSLNAIDVRRTVREILDILKEQYREWKENRK